jgi:hypothetical protein
MADDLEQTIRDNAQGPAEAAGDVGRVRQHSPVEQIAVDRYLESKKAIKKKGLRVLLQKLIPPGTD